MLATENLFEAASPFRLSRAAKSGLSTIRSIAAASPWASPGFTKRASSPSCIVSCKPPTEVATTGVPARMASRYTRPKASVQEGNAKMSAPAIIASTRSLGSHPWNVRHSPTPSARARASTAG
jgi:hypothetical protein